MAETILGVDFGARRIGLALASSGERPQRLTTLANGGDALAGFRHIIESQVVTAVVIGLPRNLDGEDTAQTQLVRSFAAQFQKRFPELPLTLQDEAVTSELAQQRLQEEGSRNPKELLDQEAAVIILEDYFRDR